MTHTFQPGDRIRTTRLTTATTGFRIPTESTGAVDTLASPDSQLTRVIWDDVLIAGRLVPTDALALEVNGL